MTATNERATRERIHQIAAALFARNGYHGTGIAELSEAVGLGRGALYYHISSKESVLYAISMGAIQALLEPSELILREEVSAEERMRKLARALMRNIADFSNEWTVFFREHIALTGQWRDEVMAKRERYEQLWARLLDEGAANGELTKVEPIVVKGVLGMFNYSYLWIRAGGAQSPEAIADSFCDTLLYGLLRAGSAPTAPA